MICSIFRTPYEHEPKFFSLIYSLLHHLLYWWYKTSVSSCAVKSLNSMCLELMNSPFTQESAFCKLNIAPHAHLHRRHFSGMFKVHKCCTKKVFYRGTWKLWSIKGIVINQLHGIGQTDVLTNLILFWSSRWTLLWFSFSSCHLVFCSFISVLTIFMFCSLIKDYPSSKILLLCWWTRPEILQGFIIVTYVYCLSLLLLLLLLKELYLEANFHKIYILRKVQDLPIWPIILNIETSTYHLAKFLAQLLKPFSEFQY